MTIIPGVLVRLLPSKPTIVDSAITVSKIYMKQIMISSEQIIFIFQCPNADSQTFARLGIGASRLRRRRAQRQAQNQA